MDVKVTNGPFGKTVEITEASPDQVAKVLEHVKRYLADPAPLPPVAKTGRFTCPTILLTQVAKDAGVTRAYLGQVFSRGTKVSDLPAGVKLLGQPNGFRHVSEDGSLTLFTHGRQVPPADRMNPSSRTTTQWLATVLEVWPLSPERPTSIPNGTPLSAWPKGVKRVRRDPGANLPDVLVTRDGRHACWARADKTAVCGEPGAGCHGHSNDRSNDFSPRPSGSSDILEYWDDEPQTAHVGQVFPAGTEDRDLPPGIKVASDGTGWLQFCHFTRDGKRSGFTAERKYSTAKAAYLRNPGYTYYNGLTVLEVW